MFKWTRRKVEQNTDCDNMHLVCRWQAPNWSLAFKCPTVGVNRRGGFYYRLYASDLQQYMSAELQRMEHGLVHAMEWVKK